VAKPEIIVREDPTELAVEASDFILREVQDSSADPFLLALAGGSTPAATYRELAELPINWSRTHFFLSDDRYVPTDDQNSNFRVAKESLFDRIDVEPGQIHRIQTELEAEAAAVAYEQQIRRLQPAANPPRLDLLLLGIGSNGHTGSIFPGEPEIDEKKKLVVATQNELVTDDGPPLRRITFTFPLINAAKVVAFIASGEAKAEVIGAAIERERPREITASNVNPDGRLVWLLDRAAASKL
jgi:6-phosphogluconolactonase